MDTEAFISRYPRLFHMAEAGSWASIVERGLLSTRALVDLYEPDPAESDAILRSVRKRKYVLTRRGLPDAIVRDQLPLKFIDQCLLPGVTVQDFLDALNSRVFFHVSEERLHRLLGARAYRCDPHDVLVVDTRSLLDSTDVELAPYNTGSVHVPNMPARGPSTFEPLGDYSWDYWRRVRGERDAVVELAIAHSVDVAPHLLVAEEWKDGLVTTQYRR